MAPTVHCCLPFLDEAAAAAQSLVLVKAGLEQAIATADDDCLRHCIVLLGRCVDLRYSIPTVDRAWLVQRLYQLALTPRLDQALLSALCDCACSLLDDSEEAQAVHLVLDWVPLFEVIEDLHFRKQRSAAKVRPDVTEGLVCMVGCVNRFFAPDAVDAILCTFRQYWCPLHHQTFKGQGYIRLFLPTVLSESDKKDGPAWLEEWLAIWNWVEASSVWDFGHTSLLARAAHDKAGFVRWDPHVKLIFTHVLRMLSLPSGPSTKVRDSNGMASQACLAVFGVGEKCVIEEAAKLIVWMLGPSGSAQVYLERLMLSVQSFFHPSGAGPWSQALGSLLLFLCKHLAKRLQEERKADCSVPREYRLSEDQVSAFVNALSPAAFTAMYANHPEMTILANKALGLMFRLQPGLLAAFLPRAQQALTSPLEVHQTLSVLHVLGPATPMLLLHHQSGVLVDLLLNSLPGIDTNDMGKTNNTLQFYCAVLSFLSLDALPAPLQPFATQLLEWAHAFLQQLLEVIPHASSAPPGSQYPLRRDLLRWVAQSLFAALPAEALRSALHTLRTWLLTNLHLGAVKSVGDICSAVVLASPETALARLLPAVVNAVAEPTGQLADLSAMEFSWYLQLLGSCCVYGGPALLPHRQRLTSTLQAASSVEDLGQCAAWCKAMKKLIRALTTTFPSDCQPHPRGLGHPHGGLGYTYADVQCQWHLPTNQEVEWAVELFNIHTGRCVEEIHRCTELHLRGAPFDPLALRLALTRLRALCSGARGLLPALAKPEDEGTTSPAHHDVPTPDPSLLDTHGLASALQFRREDLLHSLEPLVSLKDPSILSSLASLVFSLVVVQGPIHKFKFATLENQLLSMKACCTVDLEETHFCRAYVVRQAELQLYRRVVWADVFHPFTATHRRAISMLAKMSSCEHKTVCSQAQFVIGALLDTIPRKDAQGVIQHMLHRLQPTKGQCTVDKDLFEGVVGFLSVPAVMQLLTETPALTTEVMLVLPPLRPVDPRQDPSELLEILEGLFHSDMYFPSMVPLPIGDELPQRTSNALQAYDQLLLRLVDIAAQPLFWKQRLMILRFVASLIQPACRTFRGLRVPPEVTRFILDHCTAEHLVVRRFALKLLVSLCALYKPTLPLCPPGGAEGFPDHTWQGYYCPLPPDGGVGSRRSSTALEAISAPTDAEKVAFAEQVRAYACSPKGTEFFQTLFADLQTGNPQFDVEVAQLFKSLFQVLGPQLISILHPFLAQRLPPGDGEEGVGQAALVGTAECFAGLARGLKYYPEEQQAVAWQYVESMLMELTPVPKVEVPFLQECMNFCTYNQHPIRTWPLRKFWLDRLDLTMDRVASLPLMALSFVDMSGLWRYPEELQLLLGVIMDHFDHSYLPCRSTTAVMIADAFTRGTRPVPTEGTATLCPPKADLEMLKFHRRICDFYRAKKQAAGEEVVNAINISFAVWYTRQSELSIFVEPYALQYLDHLVELYDETSDKEAFSHLNLAVLSVGQGLFTQGTVHHLWRWLHCHIDPPVSNWRCLNVLLALLQLLLFSKQFLLGAEATAKTAAAVAQQLRHPMPEVRENAGRCITLFARTSGAQGGCVEPLIALFRQWCQSPGREGEAAKLHHAGCLGFGGIMQAFPFTVPPFMPDVLCTLASLAHQSSADVGATVKRIFADWWKSHSDEWNFGFKELFTEDQLLIITNMIYSPSYYA
eukprot:GGOE01020642.1.p1 GENE.GGOE01020642.1~~GGOE01020642.1.p1  ORF type:complete len:1699 (-),score=530.51 GGOE01020642.1:979-6054(-)